MATLDWLWASLSTETVGVASMSVMQNTTRVALLVCLPLAFATDVSGQSFRSDSTPPDSRAVQREQAQAPLAPQIAEERYKPITGKQRLEWWAVETAWPQHLIAGAILCAVGTGLDRPKEYGPHWDGFAERYGMRLTGVVTGNAMEASVGALWGEDPRYFRIPDQPFGARLRNVIRMTFVARRRDGGYAPAYARIAATAGNNFLSNTWRADSEANNHDAVLRTLEGFAGRMASNAYEEFWPDVKQKLFGRGST